MLDTTLSYVELLLNTEATVMKAANEGLVLDDACNHLSG